MEKAERSRQEQGEQDARCRDQEPAQTVEGNQNREHKRTTTFLSAGMPIPLSFTENISSHCCDLARSRSKGLMHSSNCLNENRTAHAGHSPRMLGLGRTGCNRNHVTYPRFGQHLLVARR